MNLCNSALSSCTPERINNLNRPLANLSSSMPLAFPPLVPPPPLLFLSWGKKGQQQKPHQRTSMRHRRRHA